MKTIKTLLVLLLGVVLSACVVGPERRSDYYGGDKDYYEDYDGPDKVLVCHKGKTMSLPESAMGGHLGHGDHRGPCR
jgi:hypothetical protein